MTDPSGPFRADLELRCINTVRFLAADAVQKANSGHPGLPMGAAAMAHALFTRHLRFDPAAPAWPDRDRFVLSAGHGSMLLYALLHLTGYDVSLDDLTSFRQWGSKTPGHPEYGHTPGVETTTGPLGQGIATAVGMAMGERFLAATFNGDGPEVQGHFTYVLAGDGDMMEGVSSEAASFAGHQGLGRLIVLYDDNHITIDGEHRSGLHRGRLRALRVVRLARAGGRRRQRRERRRRRPCGGEGRTRSPVADRGSHPHRLRFTQPAGHLQGPRRATWRRRARPCQGTPGLSP